MRGISGIIPHSLPAAPQAGANVSAGQGGVSFQVPTLTRSLNAPTFPQGGSPNISSSLGSQTLSTLLQTQDEMLVHSSGSGGHHHGAMKLTPSLEAEEAAETEEAQNLRKRKKLLQTDKTSETTEALQVDENGNIIENQTELNDKEKNGGSGSLP